MWFSLEVEENETIQSVKQKIEEQILFPALLQLIIYSGAMLADSTLLSDFSIGGHANHNCDTFYLILKY